MDARSGETDAWPMQRRTSGGVGRIACTRRLRAGCIFLKADPAVVCGHGEHAIYAPALSPLQQR